MASRRGGLDAPALTRRTIRLTSRKWRMTTTLPVDQMIDTWHGTISREIFVSPDFYREELEKLFTAARGCSSATRARSPIPATSSFAHGRRVGDPVPRRAKRGARLPELLPASRHESVPLRTGQHVAVRLPVSRLELHDRRQAPGRAAVRALYEGVLNRERMVADRGAAARPTRARCGRPGTAARRISFISRRRGDHLDQVLDCRDGREGGSEVIGVHKWVFPVELEVRGGEFPRRHLSQSVAPLGRLIGIGPSAAARQKGRRDNEYNKGQHVWVELSGRATACTAC